MKPYRLVALAGTIVAFAACSNSPTVLTPQPKPTATPTAPPPPVGSLGSYQTLATIGSTVDPGPGPGAGDQNPYGLAIATATSGSEVKGNLLVCNFNDAKNVQGAGTTIVQLTPTPGSTPTRFAQSSSFAGCNAIAMAPNGNLWLADYTANNNPIVAPSGTINTTFPQNTWYGPWGQAFNTGTASLPTFFETNAKNGTVTRIHIMPGPTFSFDTVLSGLSYNSGMPGNILAPAGLTYDKATDSLYVVDSNANRVIKIAQATTAPASSYATSGAGFTSPNVSVVYSGAPLSAPISSALLANGHLVVGNTGDNNLVEIDPALGSVISTKLVDTGAAGAIFGIATTTAPDGTQYVYFNNDNTNTVVRLSP